MCLVKPISNLFVSTAYVCIIGDVTAQVALQPALKFNGGGHINHTIFWTNLSPNGGGEPQGKASKHPLYALCPAGRRCYLHRLYGEAINRLWLAKNDKLLFTAKELGELLLGNMWLMGQLYTSLVF